MCSSNQSKYLHNSQSPFKCLLILHKKSFTETDFCLPIESFTYCSIWTVIKALVPSPGNIWQYLETIFLSQHKDIEIRDATKYPAIAQIFHIRNSSTQLPKCQGWDILSEFTAVKEKFKDKKKKSYLRALFLINRFLNPLLGVSNAA